MWLPTDVVEKLDRLVRIRYVSVRDTRAWNENRREGELRMLTGWCWIARDGSDYRQGFKTATVCYRDAYYALVVKAPAPGIERPRLRRVA